MTHRKCSDAILASHAEPGMKLLLLAVANGMRDGEAYCVTPPDVLALLTGQSLSTVKGLLAEGVACGILRRWDGGYLNKSTAIDWDALRDLQPKQSGRGGARQVRA